MARKKKVVKAKAAVLEAPEVTTAPAPAPATKPKRVRKNRTVKAQFEGPVSAEPQVLSAVAKAAITDPETGQALLDPHGSVRFFTAAFEVITPDYARYVWNNLNTANRRVQTRLARSISKAVSSNKFAMTGQTIIFDWNGELQDGQHRIYGVADSGKKVTALVVRGAPPENFTLIDNGKSRGADDCLHIAGVKYADRVAGVARRLKQYLSSAVKEGERRVSRRGCTLQNDEVIPFVRKYPGIKSSVEFTMGLTRGSTVAGLVSPTLLGFCHYVFSCKDKDMASEFVRLLAVSGDHSLIRVGNAAEPVLKLRERLAKLKTNKAKGYHVDEMDVARLVFTGWNSFCTSGRRTISKLQMSKTPPSGEKYLPKLRQPTQKARQTVAVAQQVQNQNEALARLMGPTK